MLRKSSGGFAIAEFAIALPLLILLLYGAATVGIKIIELGKIQLADYVLEEEVHDVLSRLIYDARSAKSVTARNYNSTLTITYRTIKDKWTEYKYRGKTYRYIDKGDILLDKSEDRVYLVYGRRGEEGSKIDYKRQVNNPTSPITGENYFGSTRVVQFKFDKLAEKVLRVTLEMQSEISGHKIKISTAIYMPGCENFEVR